MADYTKLPQFLKNKASQFHSILSFNGNVFVILIPYALYRINGQEYSFQPSGSFISREYKFIGNTTTDAISLEVFSHLSKKWIPLLGDENMYRGSIFKSDIEELERKYKDYYEIDYEHDKGYISFDVQKWVTNNISIEMKVDLSKSCIYIAGIEKKHVIQELKDWDSDWQNYEQDRIVFSAPDQVNNFLRYLTDETKNIKVESKYKEIFEDVQNKNISYEEFLNLIR